MCGEILDNKIILLTNKYKWRPESWTFRFMDTWTSLLTQVQSSLLFDNRFIWLWHIMALLKRRTRLRHDGIIRFRSQCRGIANGWHSTNISSYLCISKISMSHQNKTALWRSVSSESRVIFRTSILRCQALLLAQAAKPATSVVLHHLQWHQLAVCIDKAQTRGLATVPAADPSKQSVLWNHRKKSTPITFLSPTEHQKTMYFCYSKSATNN